MELLVAKRIKKKSWWTSCIGVRFWNQLELHLGFDFPKLSTSLSQVGIKVRGEGCQHRSRACGESSRVRFRPPGSWQDGKLKNSLQRDTSGLFGYWIHRSLWQTGFALQLSISLSVPNVISTTPPSAPRAFSNPKRVPAPSFPQEQLRDTSQEILITLIRLDLPFCKLMLMASNQSVPVAMFLVPNEGGRQCKGKVLCVRIRSPSRPSLLVAAANSGRKWFSEISSLLWPLFLVFFTPPALLSYDRQKQYTLYNVIFFFKMYNVMI